MGLLDDIINWATGKPQEQPKPQEPIVKIQQPIEAPATKPATPLTNAPEHTAIFRTVTLSKPEGEA